VFISRTGNSKSSTGVYFVQFIKRTDKVI